MATEEDDPRRTHALPSYPEMIWAAISASGDSNGTTESAISDYIESSHRGELPPSHASLLAAHLSRMTEAGELLLVGDSYSRPGRDVLPAKRGRGRPPKPKPKLPVPASSSAAAPRRRGRPPKPVDPLAPAKIPRPRGRPPKNTPSSNGAIADPKQAGLAKRPRGRPPKVRPQFTEVGFV